MSQKEKTLIQSVSAALCLCLLGSASHKGFADDIEVYGSSFGSGLKPNVLFIIDNSKSMTYGTDGNSPATWDDAKYKIMSDVFKDVLADSAGKINAGILFFSDSTSGVKWPISDLTRDANEIDPNIPAGITVEQVLGTIIDGYGTWGKTEYLSGLIEATKYFRGDAVWFNGWSSASSLKPQTWDAGLGYYTDGAGMAPNPYTYLPHDAYKPGATGTNPDTSHCYNYQAYDASLSDGCAGKDLVAGSCVYVPSTTYTPSPYCPVSEECVDPPGGAQGECNAWACPEPLVQGPDVTTNAYDDCKYYNGSWEGADYQSPIGAACQGNYIILLSDGIPTENNDTSYAVNLLGYPDSSSCEDVSSSIFGDPSYDKGNCVSDIVEYLNVNDLVSGLSPSNVSTFTVGFGLTGADAVTGTAFLQHLANKGGGQFFAADNYTTLSDSLKSIINAISGEIDDFTGISIDVKSNTFSSDNRAFINLFVPSENRSWQGNVKGYFLENGILKDTKGHAALDADGKFVPNARSFWADSPDGAIISDGGLSKKLTAGSRNLYTYTDSSPPNGADLTDSINSLQDSNADVTTAMLSVPDATARTEVLNWVQTAPMSDPLHSKPVMATYPSGEVLFTMTNQGFLHAVDASTPKAYNDHSGGDELFAFIPKELLPNLQQIKTNLSSGSHIYGLDGGLTLRHDDTDGDRIIDSNETAVLYFGMRRGGNHYYALNISDINNPELMWQISGGSGGFTQLGQSWSRMLVTTVRDGGSAKKVLIFGGGYDPAEDTKTSRSAGLGNRVYVVDADSGQLLWSVGASASGLNVPDMQYSIPSDITAIDINGNGYTDHLYFGDIGGQLWRVRFDEGVSSGTPTVDFDSSATATKIADFGIGENRRFYYPPSVSLYKENGAKHLAITIASGNRASPLNTSVQDWVFMIRDPINNPVSTTVTLSDLYDATNNLIMEGSDPAAERAALALAKGWKMKLNAGEKGLSSLLVFDNKLRFTTFEPTTAVTTACGSTSSSKSRYYVMNLTNATPASDANIDESTLKKADRSTDIDIQGIASAPVLVFPPDGDSVDVYVGKESVGSITQAVKRVYWRQYD